MPLYQKLISNSVIRSGAMTVRAAELVLSQEKRVFVSLTMGEVGKDWEVGDVYGEPAAPCAGGWAGVYLRFRHSTWKQVMAEMEKKRDGEYVGTKTLQKKKDGGRETYNQGVRGQPSLFRP